ncbi:MAG TPA: cytochrome c oxidase subunit II [Bacillota bacterium]
MDIDRLERFWIMISATVLAAMMLAIVYSVHGFGMELPAEVAQIDPGRARETAPFDNPGVRQVGPDRYEVNMLASAWRFEPAEVRVPVGSTVTFRLTSLDVIHGFRIPNTNVNLMVQPGQIVEATHRFTDPGTYRLFCHEYCGAGHHVMSGMLIVER